MKTWFVTGSLALLAFPAFAQRADDNTVTAAEDAFGATLGNESIGLYNARRVRGFSPVEAGNVRIEGLYLDRQGALPTRLVEGATVRVGLSAQGYPFPAPTGLVDYRLHKAGDERVVSLAASAGPYDGAALEVDAKLPLLPGHLGVAAGLQYAQEAYYDGSDATYIRAALIPRWRPAEGVEILPFWSISRGHDEEAPPTIRTAGSFAPPQVERRRYFGQAWADGEAESINTGVIAKARIGADWALAGGVFHSSFTRHHGFAELFTGTTREGLTREVVIADPPQRYASRSGELRASRSFTEGTRLHVLHANLRTRDLQSRYGGSAAPIDLGQRPLGTPVPVPAPASFAFTERTRDRVSQQTVGLGYEGRWRDLGELSVGVQRTDYEKRVQPPGAPETIRRDAPWLVNASASWHVTPALALYAGHTRGLEESGIAPADVVNRNQALPAIRTRQSDGGLRWSLRSGMKLVAGVFDVRKPYFITDENNVFTTLGEVQHRGAELSLSGAASDTLSVVAGAVLMRPRVTGAAVDQGRIGPRPVGQSDTLLRVDLDYRPGWLQGWSFDMASTHTGMRVASRDNAAQLPAYTVVDLGARYRFRLRDADASLRLQLANVADTWFWNIYGSNSYGLTDGRRFLMQLAVDL